MYSHREERRICSCSPFGGIPRNWKLIFIFTPPLLRDKEVPPSGGSLEIGNFPIRTSGQYYPADSSPFGGIPRNWKRRCRRCSARSHSQGSPFGGIPRNWKHRHVPTNRGKQPGSPFGGIPRNWKRDRDHRSASIDYTPVSLRGNP